LLNHAANESRLLMAEDEQGLVFSGLESDLDFRLGHCTKVLREILPPVRLAACSLRCVAISARTPQVICGEDWSPS